MTRTQNDTKKYKKNKNFILKYYGSFALLFVSFYYVRQLNLKWFV